ncbi:hypothetical protein PBI_MOVA_86 [Mycobacterium phage Mova]|nr:hypothetical protein PBI_MOVA_86 [Mycobacterium phage Mova]
MGLDTTHDCWHGAYSGFTRFREVVGRAAGLPYIIPSDPDHWSHGSPVLDFDWDLYTLDNYQGRWRKKDPVWRRPDDIYGIPKQDDVLYLLIHSDCDGELRRGYLPRLKARLEELEPEYERLANDDDYLRGRLHTFIEGLGRAIDAGEHVRFG